MTHKLLLTHTLEAPSPKVFSSHWWSSMAYEAKSSTRPNVRGKPSWFHRRGPVAAYCFKRAARAAERAAQLEEAAPTREEEQLEEMEHAARTNYGVCSGCHANCLLTWGTNYCATCAEDAGSTAAEEFVDFVTWRRAQLDAKEHLVTVPDIFRWRRVWLWGIA